jgi:hypothetical protein
VFATEMIGRVYKIVNEDESICYIGSTTQPLNLRWAAHVSCFKLWEKGEYATVSIYPYFKEQGLVNFSMKLLNAYEVADRRHLDAYEQLWINKVKSINKNNPMLFGWLYKKHYQKVNREMIKLSARKYQKSHRPQINTYMRKYYANNRDIINAKVQCFCGLMYNKKYKTRHLETQKHRKAVENL